jgi:pantoate--beta-alanine ligase
LNPDERKQSTVLFKALRAAESGARKSAEEIIAVARNVINEAPLARVDYVELADARTLQPVDSAGPNSVLLLAVFFGKTRLIDNIRLP